MLNYPQKLFSVLCAVLVTASGCCWFAQRSCFPKCEILPPTVVRVEKRCELPPALDLPAVSSTRVECPEKYSCFDARNTGLLAKRQADLKGWIKEVRARCGTPTSLPSR